MTQFLSSVNLGEDEWQRLLGRLDVVAMCKGDITTKQGIDRRGDPRMPFRRSDIPIVLRGKDKADRRSIICTRNISRGGVGLVHGGFVHPGTAAEIYLPLLDETWLRAAGTIVFCRHLTSKFHELGCQFEEPIPVEMVVDADAAARLEHGLSGDELQDRRILVLANDGDARRIADQLGEAGAEVFTAPSIDEAVGTSRQHAVELILLDYQTVRRDPGPVVARLRAERCRQAIAVFNVDGNVDSNASAESWKVDIVFGQSLRFEALIEGVSWVLAHALCTELAN